MLSKNSILVLLLLLIAITTLTAVSASDINDDAISEDVGDDLPEEIELNDNNDIDDTSNEKTDIDASDIISSEEASNDVVREDDEWKTFTELQQIIDDANEGDEIELKYNYYREDDFTGYGITIDKTLKIYGNYHYLNGCQNGGILYITADEVEIYELGIVNGSDPDAGAGAYITGDEAYFCNCLFEENTVGTEKNPGFGGAIYTKGDIYIVGCHFENNTAVGYDEEHEYAGGGGAIYAQNYFTYVNDCEFINNDVWGDGGAIVATGGLYVNYTYFEDNDAGGDGGAIYAYYPYSGNRSSIITLSNFYFNYAYGNGGAIYLSEEMEDGTFENGAAYSYIYYTNFNFNGAGGYGGAIFNYQYTEIEDCDFTRNYVNTGGGGAIYMNNGWYDETTRNSQTFGLEIHGETNFIDNTAEHYGGAIKIYAYDPVLKKGIKGILKIYDDVLFEGNNVTGDGSDGDQYGRGGALSIVDSDCSIVGATFGNNNAPKQGGAVEGGSVTNCTFESNSNPETYGTTVNNGGNNNGNNGNGGTRPDQGTSYNDLLSKVQVTFLPNPVYTTFGSGQNFQVRVIDSMSFTPISGFSVILKIYTGGSFNTITLKTNANGVALFNTAGLSIGTHTVIISNGQPGLFSAADQSSTITITKSSYKINAPKKTFKKTGVYKITVKNSAGKVVKGVKLTVKVYTGKKFKTYNVKTNAKGVASFKVKSLKKGKHKVVVTAKATGLYNAAKKTSSIKIK